MKANSFREIQVSSTLLVVIFLCVLVLGVFIFLLGVSVGKKQVEITAATRVVAQQIQEPPKDQGTPKTEESGPAKPEPEAKAPATPTASGSSSLAPDKPAAQNTTTAKAPTTAVKSGAAPAKASPPASGTGTFYVQVGAFTDKAQAAAEAEKFRKKGFPVVVAEPRPSDAKTWYRVRVGGYATREKAAEVLTKLTEAAKKKTDYRIVKD